MSDTAKSAKGREMDDADLLLAHEYDGIREYDNPLPGWWKTIFVGSIIFSAVYALYYHGDGPGKNEHEEYAAEMRRAVEAAAASAAKAGPVTAATLDKMRTNGPLLQGAAAAWKKNCVVCHGARGEGKIGPNLTDNYQLHGSTIVDIYKTIRDGVPAKGMIAWKKVLSRAQMMGMAAYVFNMRGKNLKGKPRQGKKVGGK